ncbi:MAG: hypothetical protein V2I76_00365 [Roseobacter sp.]|nr:hypothetical protein [Roseobacter sp.]
MIPERSHLSILANLTSQAPLDLDPLIFDRLKAADKCYPAEEAFPPSPAIWERPDGGPSYIGVRVRAPIKNTDFLAARLASIAVERQIHPIFLSYISKSGLQRLGFRVEQLFGLTEQSQARFEKQLSQFWRFAMVIDASDIDRLG